MASNTVCICSLFRGPCASYYYYYYSLVAVTREDDEFALLRPLLEVPLEGLPDDGRLQVPRGVDGVVRLLNAVVVMQHVLDLGHVPPHACTTREAGRRSEPRMITDRGELMGN